MRVSGLFDVARGYRVSRRLSREPVVIGGCERSGTTLLQSILSAHPRIHAIAEETWALCHGPEAGFPGRRPIRPISLYVHLGREPVSEAAWRWSEKSPANVFYFGAILERFRERVRLIQIVRDGRDVVTSMHPDNPSDPWVPIERWVAAVEAGLPYLDHPRVLTLRYEDLVTSYEEQARRICAFLDEEFAPQMQDWRAHARIRGSRNLRGGQVKEIHAGSVRKFEAEDFPHGRLVERLTSDPRARRLLERHGFL